eukprot:scaffold1719_cov186-Amphora_coffeaeformis.AAC.7
MTYCANCHCHLGIQKSVQFHLQNTHNIHVTLEENLAYCQDCHKYLGCSPVDEASRRALEKHLRQKHFVDLHGTAVFLYEDE